MLHRKMAHGVAVPGENHATESFVTDSLPARVLPVSHATPLLTSRNQVYTMYS